MHVKKKIRAFEEDFGLHENRPCTQCRHHEGPCTGHDIVEVLRLRRLTYFGHCTLMDRSSYPHILFYWRCAIKRKSQEKVACQRKRQLTLPDADRLAKDRSWWRSLIQTDCSLNNKNFDKFQYRRFHTELSRINL